ncbi:hypothetical protein [Duganella sp. BJB476]|uniref:hypothetical protein n=1 Tax=Duganella sp. BJB476 TaxID=1871176 RepID=UPI000E35451E|nr:hypothetical protein [Duganella sp. BJB476]RFP32438.1 hypothetical protein D0T21_09565 [Duganella sp. BJB476]
MHYTLNQVDRHHQVNINASAPPVLIPKRCACGNRAFAKQLAQHGKCVACQLADRVATLHEGDIEKLKHALGATSHRPQSKWGFRNYYCAGRGGAAEEAMRRLVAAGFMCAGHEGENQAYFHATKAGCKLAGLNSAGVRRATEDC